MKTGANKIELSVTELKKASFNKDSKLIIAIHPQWFESAQGIRDELSYMGIEALVITIPKEDIKIWALGSDENISNS
jgi:hypothetical protein